jgi:hypothetical protein
MQQDRCELVPRRIGEFPLKALEHANAVSLIDGLHIRPQRELWVGEKLANLHDILRARSVVDDTEPRAPHKMSK